MAYSVYILIQLIEHPPDVVDIFVLFYAVNNICIFIIYEMQRQAVFYYCYNDDSRWFFQRRTQRTANWSRILWANKQCQGIEGTRGTWFLLLKIYCLEMPKCLCQMSDTATQLRGSSLTVITRCGS